MACLQSNLHGALMFRNEMRLRWPQAWASALHSSISRVSTKTRPPRHGHAAAHSNTKVQKVWAHYQELSLIRMEEDEQKRNQWEFNPGILIEDHLDFQTPDLQTTELLLMDLGPESEASSQPSAWHSYIRVSISTHFWIYSILHLYQILNFYTNFWI